MNLSTIVVFACVVNCILGYDYEQGGDDWPEQYELCGKDKQTPVNIKGAKCDVALANSITFKNYKNKGEKKFKVLNTGGTMKVTTASTDASIILDGKGTFKLQQVHFHWGKNDSEGSEHLLNDKAFPAELHYVHYNTMYGSLGNAYFRENGLAVLGVFMEVGPEPHPTFEKFLNLSKYDVKSKGNYTKVEAFHMADMLPENIGMFYRYQGSLTTPSCDETVTWTVFDDTIKLSKEQFQEFRMMQDANGNNIIRNFRSIQPINGRPITYWNSKCKVECVKCEKCEDSGKRGGNNGSTSTTVSFMFLAVCVIFHMFI